MPTETTYEQWIRREGLPVFRGHGIEDVAELALGPWGRLGGRGAFIQLVGMEGLTGMYVGEVPPGGSLEPEKHVYDELIYIVSGVGVTEVWSPNARERSHVFEWQTGSLFAPPLNTWHRLNNASGTEPARFLAVTTAPVIMDVTHNVDFVVNNDYVFDDRFDGRDDFFNVGERQRSQEHHRGDSNWADLHTWRTNFIPDVRSVDLDPAEGWGVGNAAVAYEMGGNVLVGHMAEWPAGIYRKAHFHSGGAILLIVKGEGYTVMWPQELGLQPFKNGHGDQVVSVPWKEGSVFSPPSGWFHQHFNSGRVPARQLALRYGSSTYGVAFWDVHSGEGTGISVKEGGTNIDYDDEDPELRRRYRDALAANGVAFRMAELATVR
ncbi:MAG: Cupin type-1 protein [Chloroflexi bacterium]|nr:Cupin type-1 protein [Chloroflexota bacterium]